MIEVIIEAEVLAAATDAEAIDDIELDAVEALEPVLVFFLDWVDG